MRERERGFSKCKIEKPLSEKCTQAFLLSPLLHMLEFIVGLSGRSSVVGKIPRTHRLGKFVSKSSCHPFTRTREDSVERIIDEPKGHASVVSLGHGTDENKQRTLHGRTDGLCLSARTAHASILPLRGRLSGLSTCLLMCIFLQVQHKCRLKIHVRILAWIPYRIT